MADRTPGKLYVEGDALVAYGGPETHRGFGVRKVVMLPAPEGPYRLPYEERVANAEYVRRGWNGLEALVAAAEEYHKAVDVLFARLAALDPTFYPSESGQPWDAIVKGKAVIDAVKGTLPIEDPATDAMKAAWGEIAICSDGCETEAGCTFMPDGEDGACGGRAFYLLDTELRRRGIVMVKKEG